MEHDEWYYKWIFSSGSLSPEQIKDDHEITMKTYLILKDKGLVFDTKEQAEEARTTALAALGVTFP